MTLRIPGRVLFLIPFPGAWIVGTTDEPDTGPPERPAPTRHEVDHILENVNRVLDVDLAARRCARCLRGPATPRRGARRGHRAREPRAHHPSRGRAVWCGSRAASTRPTGSWPATPSTSRSKGMAPQPPSRTADLPLVGAAPRAELDRLAARAGRGGGPRRGSGSGPGRRDTGRRRETSCASGLPSGPPAAAGPRHAAARGRGGLGRPRGAGARPRRRALPADAPVDGAARPVRVHRAAGGRDHGRGAGLGRGPPGRPRSRPSSPRHAASTTSRA